MLKKHTGITKDTKGCEFGYTCYTEQEYGYGDGGEWGKQFDRTYVDEVFGMEAKSLDDLKKMIGAKP